MYTITNTLPLTVFKKLLAGQKQTVVVYGTSLSATAAWPKELMKYFEKQFPNQVTVINSAQSGQHSNWGLENLEERVLSQKPDLVFLEFSINDSATKHNISPQQSAANLDSMVRALRQQNPQVDIILMTMSTVWDAPDEPIGKKSASDRPNLADYYAIYRQYAADKGLPLVDHHLNWVRLQEQEEETFKRWLPDGTHPIPEGSLAVTWVAIESLLEETRRAVSKG